jgi:hypothetical protein
MPFRFRPSRSYQQPRRTAGLVRKSSRPNPRCFACRGGAKRSALPHFSSPALPVFSMRFSPSRDLSPTIYRVFRKLYDVSLRINCGGAAMGHCMAEVVQQKYGCASTLASPTWTAITTRRSPRPVPEPSTSVPRRESNLLRKSILPLPIPGYADPTSPLPPDTSPSPASSQNPHPHPENPAPANAPAPPTGYSQTHDSPGPQ